MPLENIDVHFLDLDDESINYALSCFETRQRINKEPWVLYVKNKPLRTVLDILDKGKLDLNDEIMLALHNEDTVEVWEVYKISSEYKVTYNKVGTWSTSKGLMMTTAPKWYRRGDLMV